MASILSTGISALNAYQRQLATTGHNIANVNTEGYSRQTVDLAAQQAAAGGAGFAGAGVKVDGIQRAVNQYATERLRNYSSSMEENRILHERASQLDSVISDSAAGLDQAMNQFFSAVQDVANDPSSVTARSVLLNQGSQLEESFQAMNDWFNDLRAQINSDTGVYVDQINGLTASIAEVNGRIQQLGGPDGSSPPNDLLDRRDQLITELSKLVSVSTVPQADGAINIFVGKGQAVVMGTNNIELQVRVDPAAADERKIVIDDGTSTGLDITDYVQGGALGGLQRFREEVLDPAQDSVGLVAIGLGSYFNAEHSTGMDLDGELGGDFFGVAAPQALADPANVSTLSVAFTDVPELTGSEYQLRYGSGAWSLTDIRSGQAVTMTGSGTAADPFVAEGFSMAVSGVPADGDSYRIRPVRSGARGLQALVSNVRDIAAAEPVRTVTVAGNTGTATIGQGALVNLVSGASLPAPTVTLAYDAAAKQFNLSSGGSIAYDPASDSGSTLTASLAGLGDFSFTMKGSPADGDTFQLTGNVGGTGDNRNALRLAQLQSYKGLLGNSATFGSAYAATVADVGTRTAQAADSHEVSAGLLSQATAARDAVSGVNLDEEAADLVRFQQAYQAAAQVIATASTLFDTLLSAVR